MMQLRHSAENVKSDEGLKSRPQDAKEEERGKKSKNPVVRRCGPRSSPHAVLTRSSHSEVERDLPDVRYACTFSLGTAWLVGLNLFDYYCLAVMMDDSGG